MDYVARTYLSYKQCRYHRQVVRQDMSDLLSPVSIEALQHSQIPDHYICIHHLKHNRLYRMLFDKKTVLAKCLAPSRFKHRRRLRNLGKDEFNNLIQAHRLGIEAPEAYGYYIAWILPGLISHTGVLMQYLEDFQPLSQLFSNPQQLMDHATSVLVNFYLKGINHIDLSPHNIMMHPKTKRLAVLDWQYCRFFNKTNEVQLILHAKKYLGYLNITGRDPQCHSWLEKLRWQSGAKITQQDFLDTLMKMTGRKLHLCDRLSLNPQGLGL